jgi:hypothetical protein
MRLTHAVTSWLDGPEGLSKLIIPNLMYSLMGRSSGLCPKRGLVFSSALTMSFRLTSQGGLILCILLFSSKDEERVAKLKKLRYADTVNLFMLRHFNRYCAREVMIWVK